MREKIIYLDNAATSWPKPEAVGKAMLHFLNDIGANPGRSGHQLSIEAGRSLYQIRESLSELFNIRDPLRIVFGINGTEALNLAINGILKPGDHVITSSIEHNSVMRPLRILEKEGIEITVIPCFPQGHLDPEDIEKSIRKNTAMVVLNHASNVVGTLLPVSEIGKIAGKYEILLLVDAAQTGGSYPIDCVGDNIDLLAFTGHKSLLGPQGTGGLIIGDRVDINQMSPLKTGGTGSRSEYERQPDFLPDIYESGTPNTVGLAGLNAGVEFILKTGVDAIRKTKMDLLKHLIDGLSKIRNITLYGSCDAEKQMSVVSFNVAGLSSSEVSFKLDENYNIMSRAGLHCAPAAHKTIGTFPAGTVRFSVGYFNTREEIEKAVSAVEEIAQNR